MYGVKDDVSEQKEKNIEEGTVKSAQAIMTSVTEQSEINVEENNNPKKNIERSPKSDTFKKVIKPKEPLKKSSVQLDDIKTLKEKLKQENEELRNKKLRLSSENLEKFKEHCINKEDSRSILNAYNKMRFEVDDSTVIVYVASNVEMRLIRNESDIHKSLRSFFYDDAIKVELAVDETLKEGVEEEKTISSQEVFEKLKQENELFKNLAEKLGLKLKENE